MNHSTKAISNTLFAAVVAVLIVLSGVGFGLYGLTTNSHGAVDAMSTVTSTVTFSENISSSAYMFSAVNGSMISNAWLVTAPLGMHEYAVSIKAEGLEPNGDYIVEGMLSSGSMQTVPISTQSMTMNSTSASEFQSDANGTGFYWIALASNPAIAFEQINLVYLPGMSMQNATTIASLNFQMMTTMTESSASGM